MFDIGGLKEILARQYRMRDGREVRNIRIMVMSKDAEEKFNLSLYLQGEYYDKNNEEVTGTWPAIGATIWSAEKKQLVAHPEDLMVVK